MRKIKQACNELTQSSKGFLLIDFLLAFGCLVMFIIFLLPVIYHAMNHNQSLQQAMVAEEHLSRYVTQSIGSEVAGEIVTIEGYEFNWSTEHLENKQFGCFTWLNQQNNEESMCLYVPIYKE